MSAHFEPNTGATDEWYTPAYVFEALGASFDLDVASPPRPTHVPAVHRFSEGSLERNWYGFVWMNPPFGGRNALTPWIEKWIDHGYGIALTPDRSSAEWWHLAANASTSLLQTRGRVKFERPDGSTGNSPTSGITLFAMGDRADEALMRASRRGLGWWSGRSAA